MIPRSLEARLTLQQQLLILVAIVIFAASALILTQAALYREETHNLEFEARRIAHNLEIEMMEEPNLTFAADSLIADEPLRALGIVIRDSTGKVVAERDEAPSSKDVVGASSVHHLRVRTSAGASVEVRHSPRERRAAAATLLRALLLAALPLLVLSFALSRHLARRALRPLDQMTRRADAISTEPGARTLGGTDGLEELERLRIAFDRLLQRLDAQLRAERQFASDASHELRTPLTVLSGEVELALRDSSISPSSHAGLCRAAEQVRAMQDLVEALLLLRRADETAGDPHDAIVTARVRETFEPVDLSDVLDTARRAILARYPGREQDVSVQTALDVIVDGQPALLAAAARNLLDNACKFTTAGVAVRLTLRADGEHAIVTVEDAGEGIRDEDRDRIFDPLFRGAEARASRAGFGLGLPILRRVARAHGGAVTVDRSPLGGARFTMTLPLWQPATPARLPSVTQPA